MQLLHRCIVRQIWVALRCVTGLLLTLISCPNMFLLDCNAAANMHPGRPEFVAVLGETAHLPCNLSIPLADDAATLILWYRDDPTASPNPFYTLDVRQGGTLRSARHFPGPSVEGRAFLDIEVHPPLLKIFPVRKKDAGDYKCRVDLRRSRTFIHYSRLSIIIPPKLVITDEHGQTMQDIIGPYDEGTPLSLFCEASDGIPQPSVIWWRGTTVLDDSYNITPQHVVRNELTLPELQRTDLFVEISCQASNTNLTKPRALVILLDLNLRPTEIKIFPPRRPLSVGRVSQLRCEVRGARPRAVISWMREGRTVPDTTETVLEEGNLTLSTYAFTPGHQDQGKEVICEAAHPILEGGLIQDSFMLDVHYPPQLLLVLGASNRHSAIKEGSDVYFDCNIKSNPPPAEIMWFKGETHTLTTDPSQGILVNERSLVLQKVGRKDRGPYRCRALNSEGEGESDVVHLDVQYTPECRQTEAVIMGVGQGEPVNITCEVDADPSPIAFQWTLNSTIRGRVDLKRRRSRILKYVPRALGDYGTVMCWAKNEIGLQHVPCVYHIVPEGEVTTDMVMYAPDVDEDEFDDASNEYSSSEAAISPAVGLLVGVLVAIIVMATIVIFVIRIQSSDPKRRQYFEEEKLKYSPSPIKKEPTDSLIDANEKSPDIIPLPDDVEVYATTVAVELCPVSPIITKQSVEAYYTVESQTCV